jgi:hypothetical protein
MVIATMLALSVVAFLATGAVLYSRQRNGLRAAMVEDGFKAHEIRKAMSLHARGKREELVSNEVAVTVVTICASQLLS